MQIIFFSLKLTFVLFCKILRFTWFYDGRNFYFDDISPVISLLITRISVSVGKTDELDIDEIDSFCYIFYTR